MIQCKIDIQNKIEYKDYVRCKICNFHGKSLKKHITDLHKYIDVKLYEKENGKLICSKSSERYVDGVKSHDSWIKVARDNGKDLTEYWSKVSNGVKNAIISDDNERKRRSNQMKLLNDKQQSDSEFKKIVSETAKKTSSRKDILEKRSEQLKKWRDENPEEFFQKCIRKMLTTFHTKPEKKLYEFLTSLNDFNFKYNQFVFSNEFFSKLKRKQIDLCDHNLNIYIEFDGILHFQPKRGQLFFENVKLRDDQLDSYIIKNNYILIRVSYDQFISKQHLSKCYFKQECLDNIIKVLNNKIPGIYRIGEAYGKY